MFWIILGGLIVYVVGFCVSIGVTISYLEKNCSWWGHLTEYQQGIYVVTRYAIIWPIRAIEWMVHVPGWLYREHQAINKTIRDQEEWVKQKANEEHFAGK